MKKFMITSAAALLVCVVSVWATALTSERNTPSRVAKSISLTVKDAEVIYAGAMVAVDGNGEAVNAADSANYKVVGRAASTVDNTDDGLSVNVDLGVFRWVNSGPYTDANIGDVCYVLDNQTVTNSAGSNYIVAGLIVDVDDSGVWVLTGLNGLTKSGTFNTLSVAGAATMSSTLGVTGVATFTAESVHNGGIDADYLTTDAGSGVDTKAAGTLPLGAATANKVEVANTNVETEIQGTLDVHEAANFVGSVEFSGDITVDGIAGYEGIVTNYDGGSVTTVLYYAEGVCTNVVTL